MSYRHNFLVSAEMKGPVISIHRLPGIVSVTRTRTPVVVPFKMTIHPMSSLYLKNDSDNRK